MLPLVQAFLDEVIEPVGGDLREHCLCFRLLHIIVSIFSLGPVESMMHVEDLQKSIIAHHKLYVKLYPSAIKPKFHQLLHLPEDMVGLGSLLSCFPTERKHRSVKSVALHVFRNYEHTVLLDLVVQQLTKLSDDSVFARTALVDPMPIECSEMAGLSKAQSARLPCCEVRAGDLILHSGDSVSEVVCFWAVGELMVAETRSCGPAPGSQCVLLPQGDHTEFLDIDCIERPLVWAQKQPGVARVCMPVVRHRPADSVA